MEGDVSALSVLENNPESDDVHVDVSSAVSSDTMSDMDSENDTSSDMCVSGADNERDNTCTCACVSRAHKRDCPMSSRKRYCGRAPSSPPNSSHKVVDPSARGDELELASTASDGRKCVYHPPKRKTLYEGWGLCLCSQ